MKLTFLGTGTSQGIPVIGCKCKVCQSNDIKDKRLRTAALIEEDGVNMAVDTGPDFRMQMLKARVDHLEAILMTHYHNDHIAGLDDIRPFNFKQGSAMSLYADNDTAEVLTRKFDYVFDEDPYPGAPSVDLIKHNFEKIELPPFTIQPFQVMHGKLPITSYQINNLVYITDANAVSDEVKTQIEGCDVLVLNALRKKKHYSHFNLEEAIEFAHSVKAKKTYLLHVSHLMGLHSEVEKELPENIFLAYDGLEVIC